MLHRHRNKIVALAVGLVVAVGAVGAIAATGALSPSEESEAVIDDAAERLGVQPSALSAALKAALKARVDAAVEAGRLTEAQGAELKQRIDSEDFPVVGKGPGGHHHGPGFGHGASLEAAASYLDMTEAELRTAVEGGKTLAEVAQDRDKSVEGLVDAMVAAATQELEQAVEDERLTEAQKDSIVATLEERITAKVNGQLGRGRGGHGFGPPGWRPPGAPGDGSSDESESAYVA